MDAIATVPRFPNTVQRTYVGKSGPARESAEPFDNSGTDETSLQLPVLDTGTLSEKLSSCVPNRSIDCARVELRLSQRN